MRTVSFIIPGRLRGKGRHRAVIRAGRIATYTPAETISTEAVIRSYASESMRHVPVFIGPLRLSVRIVQERPKSWSKKRAAQSKYITGRPDLDNVVKALGDAMNHIVYADDSQIAELHVRRCFSEPGEPLGEHVRVRVEELEAMP